MKALVCIGLTLLILAASMSMAIDDVARDRIHKRPMTDQGSSRGLDDAEVTCTTIYYYVCGGSGSCISSTAAGSCCNDCRKADHTHSPCNACSAN